MSFPATSGQVWAIILTPADSTTMVYAVAISRSKEGVEILVPQVLQYLATNENFAGYVIKQLNVYGVEQSDTHLYCVDCYKKVDDTTIVEEGNTVFWWLPKEHPYISKQEDNVDLDNFSCTFSANPVEFDLLYCEDGLVNA